MSKASDWANSALGAKAVLASCPIYRLAGESTGIHLAVEDSGDLYIGGGWARCKPAEAIRLGQWLLETFGE